jgi:hypothetical protein
MTNVVAGSVRLPFDEVLVTVNTRASRVDARDYKRQGRLPVVDQGKNSIVGYVDDEVVPINPGDSGAIVFGDHTCVSKFVDFPFAVGADGTKVLRSRDPGRILTRYIACLLEADPVAPTGYNRHFSILRERSFNLPNMSEQRGVVRISRDADALIAALERLLNGSSRRSERSSKG